MAVPQSLTFASGENKNLIGAEDNLAGGVALQITAISGATVTVRLTQDNTNFVDALMIPVGSATGVTSATATGAWRVDCSGFVNVNVLSTGGTCTIKFQPYRG